MEFEEKKELFPSYFEASKKTLQETPAALKIWHFAIFVTYNVAF